LAGLRERDLEASTIFFKNIITKRTEKNSFGFKILALITFLKIK
jgi:hypothetical protein